VIELCWVLAGPLLGQTLGDLGAEVIKVEAPRRADVQRTMPPFLGAPSPDTGASFNTLHRNKKSVVVDLATPAGQEALRELVRVADVVIENLSPKVLKGFGLSYPSLKAARPDLVMVSISAAGHTGPLARMMGYGPTTGALCGFEGLVGYDGERPLGAQQLTYGDPLIASYAATATIAALYRRRQTGRGAHLDVAQMEVTLAAMGAPVLEHTLAGVLPQPAGNRHPRWAPHGCYPCLGDDQWVTIVVASDDEWRRMRLAVGDPAWAADPALDTAAGRKAREAVIDREIAAWTRGRDKTEVTRILQTAGVAALPVYHTLELPGHPQLAHRGIFPPDGHPDLPPAGYARHPWNLTATPPAVRRPAPGLAEHNREIFRGLLGLSESAYRRLVGEGAISEPGTVEWAVRWYAAAPRTSGTEARNG
jgi:benzylsuccinate CoA-transferase BbsF subunit